MGTTEIFAMIQTISIVLAIVLAMTKLKDRGEDKAGAITKMQVDIEYIKMAVDKLDPILQRVTTIEESTKSAHKRLDEHLAKHG